MEIGGKIRKLRKLKGFSQDFMAHELNISQVAYSDLENDKSMISIDRLENISSILGMDIKDVLTFDETKIFNNTFNDSAKGFFNVQKVINHAFNNERESYLKQIEFLKDEITYLRNKLDSSD
ncbi:MAG: helix-turn-helix transcriptional regulator [Winogradskyella sp.]|uniref:helix-turn-helix domain-containing protein n=1 Tax=Winogradskyella sp. TaxID=1883156 RepID=UPI001841333D|nr:helix-turn-helix transcriptional regulator [Winogradskyella sp.]MBT8243744.1 helix-turn-helix domain-containing protein [Winogradskyella sp.]NNK22063.1 helix-turn-helix transcriptional regulator [Winogradskyella sp.]